MICIYYVVYTYKEGIIAKKTTHKNMTSIKYMCVYKEKENIIVRDPILICFSRS
jgi:hypothetical protein